MARTHIPPSYEFDKLSGFDAPVEGREVLQVCKSLLGVARLAPELAFRVKRVGGADLLQGYCVRSLIH